jgi:anti-sigma B factor antagonist
VNLTVNQQARDRAAIVDVAGDVDVYTSYDLRRVLLELSSTGHHHVVADLTGCTYLDTTGLVSITAAAARARAAGGDLMIAAAGEQVLKVLRVTGLTGAAYIRLGCRRGDRAAGRTGSASRARLSLRQACATGPAEAPPLVAWRAATCPPRRPARTGSARGGARRSCPPGGGRPCERGQALLLTSERNHT